MDSRKTVHPSFFSGSYRGSLIHSIFVADVENVGSNPTLPTNNAGVAQLVEGPGLPIRSDKVHIVGSNPTTRSIFNGVTKI